MSDFSREELSNIALAAAKEAARQTLNETFAMLGVNLANFEDMKRMREDLQFIRHMREGAGNVGARFVLAVTSVIAGAIAIGAWEFLKAAILHH